MTHPIRITRATQKKPKPKDHELGFGTVFTDHMFVADFQEEKGWYDPADRALRPAHPRAGRGGAPLRPGDLRRAQGVPRAGRPGPALPAAEARRADEPLGPAPLHPGARSGARPPVAGRAGAPRAGLGAVERRHRALHPADDHRQRAVPRRAAGEAVPLLRDPVARRRVLQGRHEPRQDPRRGQVRPRGRRAGRAAPRRAANYAASLLAAEEAHAARASPRCCGWTAPTGSTWTRWAP